MSESLLPGDDQPRTRRRHAHRKRRRLSGCLPMLLVILGFAVLAVVFVPRGIDEVRSALAGPEDYPGPGTGEVLVVIDPGQSVASMGEELAEMDVVASSEAFVDAASSNPQSTGIQAGNYLMKEQMTAADAVAILVDPANVVQTAVTVPEGLRVEDTVALLAKETDFSRKQFDQVLAKPGQLGLPKYAEGDPEGYLFPATYPVTPSDTPESILKAMVTRWRQAADEVGLTQGAKELGYTPQEIMTIASLIEAEAPPEYMPQVARVIYNRLEQPDAETRGFLQLDATVNYAHGTDIGARTTDAERRIDSPYNTYRYQGLPPGPIESPGEDAMAAALAPDDGDWLFYVTVNLATGETKFAVTGSEHQQNVAELNEYCRTQSDRC